MDSKKEGLFQELKPYWWLFLGVIIACGLYWTGVKWWVSSVPSRGQFGDAFGALNALFAGLAFAGLLIALYLQRQDLKVQSDILKKQAEEQADTRDVLRKQHEQFALQTKTMQKQAFENTFFKLISLHHEIVNATSSHGTSDIGRAYFNYLYNDELRRYYSLANTALGGHGTLEIIIKGYTDFNEVHNVRIGHYFRNLYNTIKFVTKSNIDDKRLYTNLIRAQLSSSEMGLLFYSSLWYSNKYDNLKFKELIEEYSLFDGLPIDILFNPGDHQSLYAPSAYGKSD